MSAHLLVSVLLASVVPAFSAAPAAPAKAKADGVSGATAVHVSSGTAKAKGGKKAAPAEDPLLKTLKAPLAAYIAEASRDNDGLFAAEDPDSEETWMLELKGIGVGKVRKPSPKEAIVRVQFVRRSGGEPGDKDSAVLMDFTLADEGGKWTVTDEAVASVDGKERFTYGPGDQRQPVDSPKDREEDDDGMGNGPGLSRPVTP